MKLTFRDLERDIERYLDRYGTPTEIGGHPAIRGYDEALRNVFQAYLDHGAYDGVVDFLLTFNWEVGINDLLLTATETLLKDRQINKLKRLWRGVVAKQRRIFWELHALRDQPEVGEKQLLKAKELALDSMRRLEEMLVELGDAAGAEQLSEEIGLLEREEHPPTPSPPDPRAMDESLFWEVIESARGPSGSVAEWVERLVAELSRFKPRQIVKFDKLLEEKMQTVYRWDVWALAYLAQDGCSDDAFEAFRAWLILQGREVFERAVRDVGEVLDDVPSGLGTQAGELLTAAEIAYEARSGKPLVRGKRKGWSLSGEPWGEDDLEGHYPEVFRRYRAG